MKGFREHPDVAAEIEAAALWYEGRGTGPGEEFVAAVEDAIAIICEAPAAWPLWPGAPSEESIRRYVMRRYPFAIAFLDEQREVIVIAVAHTSREPFYWRDRR